MEFSDNKIKQNKKWLEDKEVGIRRQSDFIHLLSDPTRVKILLLLKRNKELCVSEIAEILGVSISAISHQLKLLEQSSLVTSLKMGRTVCYFFMKGNQNIAKLLNDKSIANQLV